MINVFIEQELLAQEYLLTQYLYQQQFLLNNSDLQQQLLVQQQLYRQFNYASEINQPLISTNPVIPKEPNHQPSAEVMFKPLDLSKTKQTSSHDSNPDLRWPDCLCPVCGKKFSRPWLLKGGKTYLIVHA